MKYRPLGKTGLDVSVISLGTEYLVKATQQTVTEVVHAAVDQGINYFDVLFANPEYRDHFGQAFQGLRERIIITGHLPVTDSVEQCRASFLDHLARLRVDWVDIIFVSCCDGETRYQQTMQPGGHYDLAAEFVRQGKARHIAFSSHTVPVALQAVRSGKFDVLMFPINPAFDRLPGETGTDDLGNLWEKAYFVKPEEKAQQTASDHADGDRAVGDLAVGDRRQLYLECASRGVGLVAMKPFAAGWLFRPDLDTGFRPANLLHYALSQPGVSCVVPGAANLDQLNEDLAYLTATADETDYSAALAKSRWNSQGACMYCSHCQPCTAGIDIAEVNRLLDQAANGSSETARQAYQQLTVKASACQECADCMQRCPFGIDVINRMQHAVALFEVQAV
jgi:uncharacterized protein